METWIWKWIYLYPNKIMFAYFSSFIPKFQLFNQKSNKSGKNVFSMIELEIILYYIYLYHYIVDSL
jgi:hypothetical protein